jgi:ElaB/YqjD/DUF883 family membrane-anchored ribosome-binding protein
MLFSSSTKSSLANSKQQMQETSKDISKEFKNFLCEVEDLFKQSTSLTGDDLAKAKEKFNERVQSARETLGETGETIMEQARRSAKVANTYVHEKPWTTLGAGVAISFLVGYLLASSRD